jgi:hypothetical protein
MANSDTNDYDLKIDDQVSAFSTLNHAVTFFYITAAIGTFGFSLNFLVANNLLVRSSVIHVGGVIVAALTALGSAGFALLALHEDIKSFRLHLKYRYQRKKIADLNPTQQSEWDNINKSAGDARKFSLGLLVVTVVLQVFLLIFTFVQKGNAEMHHYGEDSTEVIASENAFDLVFTNKDTGQKITMHVPRVGVMENPTETPTLNKMKMVANEVAHTLRQHLGGPNY